MSSKKPKATRKRMISCFAQIVQEHIPLEFTHFLRAAQREARDGGKKSGNRPPFFGKIPTCKKTNTTRRLPRRE